MWPGINQSVESQNEQKHGGRANLLFLLELGHPSCPVLRHHSSDFLGLLTWKRIYITDLLVLRPSN
jgi:hypothetical protein